MKKRFLAIFIVVLMLFSQITVFASDLDLDSTSIKPEDKISNELKKVMNKTADDKYIQIVVWLNSYGDDLVYLNLSSKYGFDVNSTNENVYIESKILSKSNEYIKRELLQKSSSEIENKELLLEQPISWINKNYLNLDKNITENEIKQFIEESMTISKVIEVTEKARFLNDWRDSRKAVNVSINNAFISKLNATKTSNIQSNELITCVLLNCEKTYIYELARFNEVERIEYGEYEIESVSSKDQDDSDQTNEQHHMLSQDYLGYDGSGIKIGVLDFRDGTNNVLLDANNVHLKNKFSNGKINTNYSFCAVEESNRLVDDHATFTISILCGDEVNGYKGVAPNATVYYAPFDNFPVDTNISEGGVA